MVKMPNKAHKYTDYMHSLTNYVHKICDLHEYRLLTHAFPPVQLLAGVGNLGSAPKYIVVVVSQEFRAWAKSSRQNDFPVIEF